MKALPTAAGFALAVTLLSGAPPSASFDFGGALNKAIEKREAIVKTSKAMRKGFAELTGQEEYYIGRSVAARILGTYPVLDDPEKTRYINEAGLALAAYSNRPETYGGYHFLLLDSQEINAYAAPGGFIFITSGLYSLVETEDQLAAVLAHEIGHVTLRHGLSAIKSSRLTEAFTILGTEAAKEYSSAQVAQLSSVFEGTIDDIANKLIVSGYSRKQEYAADEEAVRIAYRAGYNPAALPEFLKSLRSSSSVADGQGFYKTHPPARDRLDRSEKFISRMSLEGTTDPARTERFEMRAMK
jgi:predicted Zn-dependent protease